VKHRLPPWLVLVLLVVVCGLIVGGVALYRGRMGSTATLLRRLPNDGAVVLYADFRALRKAGVLSVLAASRVTQEPEYRAFVDRTGFDYLNDLESALVSFHPSGTFFLLKGRFDWKALKDFTVAQGGTCYNALCRMAGSTPERKISYFPLQPNVMALAVSNDDYAATHMQERQRPLEIEIPPEPVWWRMPVPALKNNPSLPAGTKMFVRALEGAHTVLFSAGPSGTGLAVSMEATCPSAAAASVLTEQLRSATAQLRELIAREHLAANPADLSGVLVAGAFEQRQERVIGRWPVERAFLTSLAGGAY
jgi:hypothetical protein